MSFSLEERELACAQASVSKDLELQDYLSRKRAEGKTGLEAMRRLKRDLTRRVWRLLQPPTPTRPSTHTIDLLS